VLVATATELSFSRSIYDITVRRSDEWWPSSAAGADHRLAVRQQHKPLIIALVWGRRASDCAHGATDQTVRLATDGDRLGEIARLVDVGPERQGSVMASSWSG
jgi:hypothetical protein